MADQDRVEVQVGHKYTTLRIPGTDKTILVSVYDKEFVVEVVLPSKDEDDCFKSYVKHMITETK